MRACLLAASAAGAGFAIFLSIASAAPAAALAVEQDEFAAEALEHDLGRIFVLARLVLPFAGLELPFQVDLRAFAQVRLGDLAEILVEDDNAVPFVPPLAVAVAVFPALGRGAAPVHALPPIFLGSLPRVTPHVAH